jgi:hypothetical protein
MAIFDGVGTVCLPFCVGGTRAGEIGDWPVRAVDVAFFGEGVSGARYVVPAAGPVVFETSSGSGRVLTVGEGSLAVFVGGVDSLDPRCCAAEAIAVTS